MFRRILGVAVRLSSINSKGYNMNKVKSYQANMTSTQFVEDIEFLKQSALRVLAHMESAPNGEITWYQVMELIGTGLPSASGCASLSGWEENFLKFAVKQGWFKQVTKYEI
jgi:hypothetical protein